MSVMDWYNIGYQTGPAAGLGQAIRGILDLHTKMSQTAGEQLIKSSSPLEQAHTAYYNASANNPLMQLVNSGASGDTLKTIMDNYEPGVSGGKMTYVRKPVVPESQQKRDFFADLISRIQSPDSENRISKMDAKTQAISKGWSSDIVNKQLTGVTEPRVASWWDSLLGRAPSGATYIPGTKTVLSQPVTTQPTQVAGQQMGQYQIGQQVSKGGKTYTIVGFDKDGEPLVE
jgi:hypothetical protein